MYKCKNHTRKLLLCGSAAAEPRFSDTGHADATEAMASQLAVHRCRFVDSVPHAVEWLEFQPGGERLAVLRANGDIEVWAAKAAPALALRAARRRVPTRLCAASRGASRRRRTRGAASRAVCTGSSRWDLGRLSPAASHDSARRRRGGARRTAASTFAVGCEDGGTTLYDTRGGGEGAASVCARLPSQGSRVLSLALDPAGAHAACGAADGSVAVWALAARTLVSRIELEGQARKPPLVWSVLLFADLSVVTGDSAGSVRFWDGRHGTLLSSVQSHQSDILALAGTHRAILAQFCAILRNSGAIILRPVLLYSHRRRPLRARRRSRPQSLTLVPKPEADRPAAAALAGLGHAPLAKWTLASSRRPHTHDVRALAVRTGGGGGGGGSVVVSAGIDTQASPRRPATPNARSPRPASHTPDLASHTPDLASRA